MKDFGVAIATAVLLFGAGFATCYYGMEPEVQTATETRFTLMPVPMEIDWSDLARATEVRVDTHRVETQEECLPVPQHLVLDERPPQAGLPAWTGEIEALDYGRESLLEGLYRFLLLPLSDAGEPAVTLGRDAVTIQTYTTQGTGMEFEYTYPERNWRFYGDLSVQSEIGLAFWSAGAFAMLEYRGLGFGPGALAVHENSTWLGWGFQVSYQPTIYEW